LTSNDLEIHIHRFEGYIEQLENIGKQLKSIAVQYNEQRINKLKTIFTKIKNYEN
jgi:thiaminase